MDTPHNAVTSADRAPAVRTSSDVHPQSKLERSSDRAE